MSPTTPTSGRALGWSWSKASFVPALLFLPSCAAAPAPALRDFLSAAPACYSWTEVIGETEIDHRGGVVFYLSGDKVYSRAWFDRAATVRPWPPVEGVGALEGDTLTIQYGSVQPGRAFYWALCGFEMKDGGRSFHCRFVQHLDPSPIASPTPGTAKGTAIAPPPEGYGPHVERVRKIAEAAGVPFTTGAERASKFGVHEIALAGDGNVPNPFETEATVTFTPPSGPANAIKVFAFYDGGNTWRARLYVTETGDWTWTSASPTDKGLASRSGKFAAAESKLRGMLRNHPANPKAWRTDDGRWFCNVSDTAYRLFHSVDAPMWREFVDESVGLGVTCLRAAALGGWGGTPGAARDDNNTWVWNDPWAGGAKLDFTRFDLEKFHTAENRLVWIFDHHPDLQIQLILFSFKGYGGEGTGKWWESLPREVRERTMRYMIARFSAFPNLFWLIVNDMHCDEKFPLNRAFVREIGAFFAANDPWHHLISTGPNRRAGYPFTSAEDLKWSTYIHIEDANTVGADQIQKFGFDTVPLHVWMAEDYYEQDHGHYQDPRFFFRWLFWSWLLSGGSANYCGRWGPIHPYSQTGRRDLPWTGADKTVYTGEQLVGLDSARHIWPYFRNRGIDLGLFRPNDDLASDLDGRKGRLRPKLMERGGEEFLVYHPNASADGKASRVDPEKTARIRINLSSAPGTFRVEWFRALDGVAEYGGTLEAGAQCDLAAPWPGQDVVLRLLKARR